MTMIIPVTFHLEFVFLHYVVFYNMFEHSLRSEVVQICEKENLHVCNDIASTSDEEDFRRAVIKIVNFTRKYVSDYSGIFSISPKFGKNMFATCPNSVSFYYEPEIDGEVKILKNCDKKKIFQEKIKNTSNYILIDVGSFGEIYDLCQKEAEKLSDNEIRFELIPTRKSNVCWITGSSKSHENTYILFETTPEETEEEFVEFYRPFLNFLGPYILSKKSDLPFYQIPSVLENKFIFRAPGDILFDSLDFYMFSRAPRKPSILSVFHRPSYIEPYRSKIFRFAYKGRFFFNLSTILVSSTKGL